MRAAGQLNWDSDAVAKALNISVVDSHDLGTDGRIIGFLLERRIAYEMGGTVARNGADHDFVDCEGRKFEVRSLGRRGSYFCPSSMMGTGRVFDEAGFLRKLDTIAGYFMADIVSFPRVPFWFVSSADVRSWWSEGKLGKTTRLPREQLLALLVSV